MTGIGGVLIVFFGIIAFFSLLATLGTVVNHLIAMRWPLWLAGFAGLVAMIVGVIMGSDTTRTLGCSVVAAAAGAGTLALMVRKKRR